MYRYTVQCTVCNILFVSSSDRFHPAGPLPEQLVHWQAVQLHRPAGPRDPLLQPDGGGHAAGAPLLPAGHARQPSDERVRGEHRGLHLLRHSHGGDQGLYYTLYMYVQFRRAICSWFPNVLFLYLFSAKSLLKQF